MSRIKQCLEQLKKQGKKALVPYFVAGDSSVELTEALMHGLVAAGSDILELGVPFSDPMAEGPTIQLAHERALLNHVSLRDILALVARFRQTDNTTPIVLMGYANPIEVMGYATFAKAAAEAGIDGVLTVDLPPEEAGDFQVELEKFGIDNIFLIAPTTTTARIRSIAALASGYLYYVSLKGVTGSGNLDVNSVREKLAVIQSITDLPVCVGFGIKDADSCRNISQLADGAVVGSALVDRIAATETIEQALNVAEPFIRSLRQAMDEQ
jgi:tryptophan synthase alpha chain